MEKTILAYVAGLVDGEGCIGLHRGNHHSIYLRLGIGLTSKELIQWLHSTFEGSFRCKPVTGKNCKSIHQWELTSNQALKFLKLISPYLRLKRPQAEVAIKFQELPFRRQGHVLLEEEKTILETLRTEMSNLNKRGV